MTTKRGASAEAASSPELHPGARPPNTRPLFESDDDECPAPPSGQQRHASEVGPAANHHRRSQKRRKIGRRASSFASSQLAARDAPLALATPRPAKSKKGVGLCPSNSLWSRPERIARGVQNRECTSPITAMPNERGMIARKKWPLPSLS